MPPIIHKRRIRVSNQPLLPDPALALQSLDDCKYRARFACKRQPWLCGPGVAKNQTSVNGTTMCEASKNAQRPEPFLERRQPRRHKPLIIAYTEYK